MGKEASEELLGVPSGELKMLQEREAATVQLLDSAQAVLQAQDDLGKALSAGWMALASVRYASGAHSLDHLARCALTKKGSSSRQPTLGLTMDPSTHSWKVLEIDAADVDGKDVLGDEKVTEERVDSEGKPGKCFYGPPALREASQHFKLALGLVAEILTTQKSVQSSQSSVLDQSE